MTEQQLELIQNQIARVTAHSPLYKEKYGKLGIAAGDIKSQADFEKLPFTTKGELRENYPLGVQCVPDEEVVRIHSSSGTTGKPIIIPYTQQDLDDWADMFARCFQIAGMSKKDRVQITTGYGLWTAGAGFQAGVERFGAMAIPMGPGNTEKQLEMMIDLQTTVLCSTSSYALLLTEMVEQRGIRDQLALKKGVMGSERWGTKMRDRIQQELGIQLYDIYGLTEIYGPGISISCDADCGIHYFDDFIYMEIIDPATGEVLPVGEEGEIVITTLRKQGAPLIRYRTHDISRLLPGQCPCGSPYPRHDRIMGRSDDMVKVKGVNIYPGQVDSLLQTVLGVSSEYQIIVNRDDTGRDSMLLRFETPHMAQKDSLETAVVKLFKSKVGLTILTEAVPMQALPRSEKKTKRIFDNRFDDQR